MNNIITDWCAFCEGRKSFDKSHFHVLFWEDISANELHEIFKYFPNSEILFELTHDYLFGITNPISNPSNVLIDLAFRDIQEKRKLISEDLGLDVINENMMVEFVDDFQSVEKLKTKEPYISFFDAINDKFLDSWILEDKKAFALHEAFYGLTKYYEMVWYLFKPLTNIKVSLKYYYELTKLRGVYAFRANKLIVSQHESNKQYPAK